MRVNAQLLQNVRQTITPTTSQQTIARFISGPSSLVVAVVAKDKRGSSAQEDSSQQRYRTQQPIVCGALIAQVLLNFHAFYIGQSDDA